MNNDDEFYLTLLSNSSINYFPNNTTAKFVTQLPMRIRLTERWVVGLAEVQFPCSFLPVGDTDNLIYYRTKTSTSQYDLEEATKKARVAFQDENKTYYFDEEWCVIRISSGNYNSTEDVITTINHNERLKKILMFEYDQITKRVSLTIKGLLSTLILSLRLALQLGYKPNVNLVTNPIPSHPAIVWLGLPSQMFIYCDIVEPQVVGDVLAPLVRIVNIATSNYEYGTHKDVIFSPTHYIPVMRKEFENLEIDIRTDTGEPMPFEFGTLSIKLHFKKIKE